MKMQCPVCDSANDMKMELVNRTYDAGGLPHVTLQGVRQYTCPDCGEVSYNYGNIEELHKKLVMCFYNKPARLTGQEIVFIRKYLGYSQKMFAMKSDMSVEHLSRIETGKQPVTKLFDGFIRLILITEDPCKDYEAHDKALAKKEAKKVKPLVLALQKKTWRPKDKVYEAPIDLSEMALA